MIAIRMFRVWRHRLRSILRKDAIDGEVASELAFHRELLVREHVGGGMSRDEAEREASRVLGNVALLEEQCRDQRRVSWFHDFRQDLQYGVRVLRRNRGFSAVAVGSLALGIGANAAVLSVGRAVMFGGLPFPAADRLVVVRTYPFNAPGQLVGASRSDHLAWRERSTAFEVLGASHGFPGDLGAEAGEPAQRIEGNVADSGFFAALGAQPILGRLFADEETTDHAPQPVVISEGLWRRRFNLDRGVIGRQIRLNRKTKVIVGVLPSTFVYPDGRIEYWLPAGPAKAAAVDSSRLYAVVGRLKPGVSVQQAEADLNRIASDLARERPDSSAGWGVRVLPLRTVQYRWTWEPLFTLGLSVTIVLMLACVNLAGLLLARGAARRPELALRMALGAGRGRIVRQLVTESLLVALVAGACSALVAWWCIRVIRSIAPLPGLPPVPPIAIDGSVIGIVALLTVATSLVFGVGPAFAASRQSAVDPFRHCTAAFDQPPRLQRARGALVAAQVALALVLLVGAGLLVNTVVRVASRDLGFDPAGLVTFEFQISTAEFLRPGGSYRGANVYEINPSPTPALARVLERVAAIPGVESAAGLSHHPTNSFLLARMPILGLSDRREPLSKFPVHFLVTPKFFSTMKATIVRGREIDDSDTAARVWVAVVNETMARRFWPGQDAIGQQFVIDTLPEEQPRIIVGIVRDIPTRREQVTPEPVFYTSYLQQPSRVRAPWSGMAGRMTFVVRTAGDPEPLAAVVRRAVAEIEPDRPLTAMSTSALGGYFWLRRTHIFAILCFAVVATLLASVGLYGIMAYTLASRTREIAIRVALGADAREVIRVIGIPSFTVVGAGLLFGLAGAAAFGRLVESQLWGISATDRPTFIAASILFLAVAGLACVPPIRRALRIEPSVALRTE